MRETDLYLPVKVFLEGLGYQVKGEVNDCDVVAVREPQSPLIVELKLTLNLTVLMQAVDRLSLSDKVYIGLPASCPVLKRRKRRLTRLLKMLNIGLLAIEVAGTKGYVEVLHDPGPYQPRQNKKSKQRLLGEFITRGGDPNPGGSSRSKGLMTVYRQRALTIAQLLYQQGPLKASDIANRVQDNKARLILYKNVYGWFDRHNRGIYGLSEKGTSDLSSWLGLRNSPSADGKKG